MKARKSGYSSIDSLNARCFILWYFSHDIQILGFMKSWKLYNPKHGGYFRKNIADKNIRVVFTFANFTFSLGLTV